MSKAEKKAPTVLKKKPNTDSYISYIETIKNLILGNDVQIKKETVAAIDDMIAMVFYNLKKRALELTYLKRVATMTDSAVKHGALLELPDELVKDAFNLAGLARTRKFEYEENEPAPELIAIPLNLLREKYGNVYFTNKKFYDDRIAKFGDNALRSEVKAGLIFPIGKVQRHIRLNHNLRVTADAAISIAALLEIVTITILQKANAKRKGRNQLSPRHIMLAIKQDKSNTMLPMFHNIIIEGAGEPLFQYEYIAPAPKRVKQKTKAVVAKK